MAKQPGQKPGRGEHKEEDYAHDHRGRDLGDGLCQAHPPPVDRPETPGDHHPSRNQRRAQCQDDGGRRRMLAPPEDSAQHQKRPADHEAELTPFGGRQSS